MSVIRSSKHGPGVPPPAQVPVLGRKSARRQRHAREPRGRRSSCGPARPRSPGRGRPVRPPTGDGAGRQVRRPDRCNRARGRRSRRACAAPDRRCSGRSRRDERARNGAGVGVGVPRPASPWVRRASACGRGPAVTTGIKPLASSWKLLSVPLQTDQLERSPFSIEMARDDRADLGRVAEAAGEGRDARATRRSSRSRLKSRIDSRAPCSDVRSVAAKSLPPLLVGDAVQGREERRVRVQSDDVDRDALDADARIDRRWRPRGAPGTLSGRSTSPRSPAGPRPGQAADARIRSQHSSWPSVTNTMM